MSWNLTICMGLGQDIGSTLVTLRYHSGSQQLKGHIHTTPQSQPQGVLHNCRLFFLTLKCFRYKERYNVLKTTTTTTAPILVIASTTVDLGVVRGGSNGCSCIVLGIILSLFTMWHPDQILRPKHRRGFSWGKILSYHVRTNMSVKCGYHLTHQRT
jgi:hypothetical protein